MVERLQQTLAQYATAPRACTLALVNVSLLYRHRQIAAHEAMSSGGRATLRPWLAVDPMPVASAAAHVGAHEAALLFAEDSLYAQQQGTDKPLFSPPPPVPDADDQVRHPARRCNPWDSHSSVLLLFRCSTRKRRNASCFCRPTRTSTTRTRCTRSTRRWTCPRS